MKPLGLRVQIVVALAFLVAFATALTGFAIAQLSRRAVYESSAEAARIAAEALAVVLGSGVGAGRPASELEDIAIDSLGRAGIDEIILYGRDRERVLAVHLPGRGGALTDFHPRGLRPRSDIREGNIRIFAPAKSGAAVAVNVSLADATERLSSLERLIFGYAGISALVLLIFGMYMMTRLMVRPLERVREAAERVATGELGVRVPIEGGRELMELARSFNRMTENLRRNRDELQETIREVQARTEELQKTQAHLVRSEKLASVGRLAAGLAHEVGNPVSAILGFCDLLEAETPPEEARDYVARMKREARRVDRIVRDLLSYARPGKRGEGLADVAKAVEDATGLLWPQKGFREVEIESVVAEDLPPVRMSEEALGQVLVNLLMNAADAIRGEGQVHLEAELEESWRSRPDAKPTRAVRIIVADSGPGIPEGELAKVFDLFFTTKDPGQGTGLGLAICQSIVETAGGRIEASNGPNGGARFTLHIPAAGGS